jgi:hypothetical protein
VRFGALYLGPQLLGDPKLCLESLGIIESDEAACRREDRARASVISCQHHLFSIRVSIHKSEDVLNCRTAESIDRLIIIPDSGQVATPLRDQVYECSLESIRILILVYEEPAVSLADARGNKGIITKKLVRQEHLVAKVKKTTPRKYGPIRTIRGGKFTMFLGKPLKCIRMRTDLSTYLLVIYGFAPQRFGTREEICRKRVNLISTDSLFLRARDVSSNVTKESCRISKWGKS